MWRNIWLKYFNILYTLQEYRIEPILCPLFLGSVSMLALGLSYVTFIMLKYVLSIPNMLRALIMKGC